MNYIDLFSGAGGMSYGFKSAGFDLLFANEFDKYACQTYRRNLSFLNDNPEKMIEGPIEELYKFITDKEIEIDFNDKLYLNNKINQDYYKKAANVNLDIQKVINNITDVDFIIGGPPCQGFSTAGRGKKSAILKDYANYIDDPRNHLFKYFLGFVEHFNPKVVLIENVKGVTTAGNYKDLIEMSLENCGKGYYTISKVLNAAKFGVPQNRERIFFIGVRNDISDSEEFIFWLNSILTNICFPEINTETALTNLPNIRSNPLPNNTKAEAEIEIGNPDSFGETISNHPYNLLVSNQNDYTKKINTFRGKTIFPNKLFNHKTRYNNDLDLKIYSLMKPGKYLDHKDNYEALKLCKYGTFKEEGKVKIQGFTDKYFKIDKDKPCRTIVAHLRNDNNGYIHYGETPRGISPREAARIQSFPDWYFFDGPLSFQFKQIGNAVPPLLAFELAKMLKHFIENGLDSFLDYINKRQINFQEANF